MKELPESRASIVQDLRNMVRELRLWIHRGRITGVFRWFADNALKRIPQYFRPRCWFLGHKWLKWDERGWYKEGAYKCSHCGFGVILPRAWGHCEEEDLEE